MMLKIGLVSIINYFLLVSEISYEESLEDFNEEEDYVKFLQKENMSPMIPKPQTKILPLPVVTCEWSNKRTATNLSTYLPGLGSKYQFYSQCYLILRVLL